MPKPTPPPCPDKERFRPESADDFFRTAQAALKAANAEEVYRRANALFKRVLNALTTDSGLNLTGPFAQMDYLLKERRASAAMVKAMNETRGRFRHHAELAPEERQRHALPDLARLCRFLSFLFDTPVPQELAEQLPPEEQVHSGRQVIGDCLRMVVEEWDDTKICGREEKRGAPLTLLLAAAEADKQNKENHKETTAPSPLATGGARDRSYLLPLMRKGTQLNLVRPRRTRGGVEAEFVIFEPDLLIDITAIARCFTPYAESARVQLLNKLKPAASSEAILMGNLAGQLLDETVHGEAERPYADSVADFFRHHALALATTDISPNFHREAQAQKQHIAKAFRETLPQALTRFDTQNGLVEPSFFSEMLGIQGRMDYLQQDMKVLVEQKAGKGNFPYDLFKVPRHKEEHYVQLLLYMALLRYNFRETYEANRKELHAFLLYSKYEEPLVGLGFAPDLLFRALKLRNELAHQEMELAQPDGFRVLEKMQAEDFNEKHTQSKLWEAYLKPQIESLLVALRRANETERAYCLRFLSFTAREHLLAKLGTQTKENSGFAAKWHDSAEEKREAGNMFDALTPETPAEGTVETVRFLLPATQTQRVTNFRTGDIVLLYAYPKEAEPDVRRTVAYRGSLEEITDRHLLIRLRAPQTDPRIFHPDDKMRWAVEPDLMDSSFAPLYRGVWSFLSAPQSRRDLCLLKRAPETDTARRLNGDYGAFNELALRVKQARDLFLIVGPPGTGKTSFGLLTTVKEELTEPAAKVLLMAYTNRAVDEICSKLCAEEIPFVRLGGGLRCAEPYRPHLLEEQLKEVKRLDALKERLETTRVFVGTVSTLNGATELFSLTSFSLAVIDEASQILEPQLAGLMSATHGVLPAIRKFVMIGDHKQLPAVVGQTMEQSRVEEPCLHEILLTDCRLSLFERLLKKYGEDPAVAYMLTRQGRMHPEIADFPNHYFYQDRLSDARRPHQLNRLPRQTEEQDEVTRILKTQRTAFFAARQKEEGASDKVNETEAEMIAATIARIHHIEQENFDAERTVGVIVPYRSQIAAVSTAIARRGLDPTSVTIDTVERFQGSQRKYILYGFTVQKYYQLDFLTNNVFFDTDGSLIDRKLNVAMTRAEEHLLLFGNPELLAKAYVFYHLLDYLRRREALHELPPEKFVTSPFLPNCFKNQRVFPAD
ncbi:MAG: DEAD/DEAH box helicase [Alloprevotella sp.]